MLKRVIKNKITRNFIFLSQLAEAGLKNMSSKPLSHISCLSAYFDVYSLVLAESQPRPFPYKQRVQF